MYKLCSILQCYGIFAIYVHVVNSRCSLSNLYLDYMVQLFFSFCQYSWWLSIGRKDTGLDFIYLPIYLDSFTIQSPQPRFSFGRRLFLPGAIVSRALSFVLFPEVFIFVAQVNFSYVL